MCYCVHVLAKFPDTYVQYKKESTVFWQFKVATWLRIYNISEKQKCKDINTGQIR
jgi:hypothetical protein